MTVNSSKLFDDGRIREIYKSFKPSLIHDNNTLKPSSVLIPLTNQHLKREVILTIRTTTVKDHKGEISFPGGRKDSTDASFEMTALRETHEEIGVNPGDIEIIGQLDDTKTRSGYLIRPYVGFIPANYDFHHNTSEVNEILAVPLLHLLSINHTTREWREYDNAYEQTPVYHYGKHAIWGATARVMGQFLSIMKNGPDE